METQRWNRVLYRIGYALERAGRAVISAATDTADAAADLGADAADVAEEHIPEGVATLAGTLAATWLARRMFRAREIRWSRAVLAGVVGTLLYDLERSLDQRAFGRDTDVVSATAAALTDDPDTQKWIGRAGEYAAGIGLATIYARHLYGRLPGSPLTQGLAFGALDAATLSWGGLLPLLNRISPEVRMPLGYAGLSRSPEISAQLLLRHLAYGAGVGIVYRD